MNIINGRIITPDGVIENGTIEIFDGIITDIRKNSSKFGDVIDAHRGYVLPGIVDIHGDDLETAISPRPSAKFPVDFALLHLDRKNASMGITTKLHAIAYFEDELKSRSIGTSKEIVETMARLEDEFLTHHFAHVRCEISGDLNGVLEAIKSPLTKLVSLMDHTPGPGQFTDHTRYREYHRKIYGLNDDEIDRIIRTKSGYAGELVQKMREVAEIAHARGLSIASHDDDSPKKVELVHSIGARISEFPITLDAAKRGRELGMTISMGAPNVVLGRSTSGNLSTSEAIDAGLVDLLCSDYNPGSMLYSAFILWKRGVLTLSDAVNMITRNPAEAVGMGGTIGSIEIGKRADLLVVSERMKLPVVTRTIVGGDVVYAAGGVR